MFYANFCAPIDEFYSYNRKLMVLLLLLLLGFYALIRVIAEYKAAKLAASQVSDWPQELDAQSVVEPTPAANPRAILRVQYDQQQDVGAGEQGSRQQDQEDLSAHVLKVPQKSIKKAVAKHNSAGPAVPPASSWSCCKQIDKKQVGQLQDNFSVVMGHHLVSSVLAQMFAPGLLQLGGSLAYVGMALVAAVGWSIGWGWLVRLCWGLMCGVNVFLMASGLDGLQQSGYDQDSLSCYWAEKPY